MKAAVPSDDCLPSCCFRGRIPWRRELAFFFFFCLALQDGEEKSTHRDGKQILKPSPGQATQAPHLGGGACARTSVCRHVRLCVPEHCRKITLPLPPVCVRTPLILNFVQEPFKRGNGLGRSAVFSPLSVILRYLIGIQGEEGADREPWDQGWGRGGGEGGF